MQTIGATSLPVVNRPLQFASFSNSLLDVLPQHARRLLALHVEPVSLPSGRIILECEDLITHLYFPTTATCSLQALLEEGLAIEVAVVGQEGVIGLAALLGQRRSPNRVVVQSPGRFLRVRTELIKEQFDRNREFQQRTLRFTSTLLTIISQTSACSTRHSVKQRFCRWLLMVHDRLQSDNISVTQDFIGQLLGCRRASVTAVANDLQKTSAINHTRGNIRVLNRYPLEVNACECYKVNRQEFERFMASFCLSFST
ncbi:MAG: Crp/Fnr family transcriptional regulator [Pyrinomonadaceae bacterium]